MFNNEEEHTIMQTFTHADKERERERDEIFGCIWQWRFMTCDLGCVGYVSEARHVGEKRLTLAK